MKSKEILSETLDIDHGLFRTFLTMFSDPQVVVTHPERFTKPWKYATYVVSISCLVTWFFIHWIVDPLEASAFWDVPKRVLELSNGYANFYENTQPLKRLLIHSITTGAALFFLFPKQRASPQITTVSLYLIGHSVFLQFIFQMIATIILRQGMLGNSNVMPYIGGATNIVYLFYSMMRIYGQGNRLLMLRIPFVIAIEISLYGFISTRSQHFIYYRILARNEMHFHLEKSIVADLRETPLSAADKTEFETRPIISHPYQDKIKTIFSDSHHEFGQVFVLDSTLVLIDCLRPAGEISRLSVGCLSLPSISDRWSTIIFEKISRYSPNPTETFLRIDSVTKTAFAAYRIPNDSNSTLRLASIDVHSGRSNYNTTIETNGDDTQIYGLTIDLGDVYIYGSTQDIRKKYDLGLLIKINKEDGTVKGIKYLGDDSFASYTSFRNAKISKDRVELLVKHEYKRAFLFNTTEFLTMSFNKDSF